MLVFYKEKKYLLISLIVILLDGIIIYYIPSYFNKLNCFYPMLTISLLPFLFHYHLKEYYYFSFFVGIMYDLLYSDIFLYNALLFLLLAKIDSKVLKYFKKSLFIYFLLVFFNICLYDIISFLLCLLANYQVISFYDLIYKIKNSLCLNLLSVFVFYFFRKTK